MKEPRAGVIVYDPVKKGFLFEHCTGRKFEEHTWDIPKGHVEANEKAIDAAVRELKEESHIDFKGHTLQEIGVYPYSGDTITLFYLEVPNLDPSKCICTTYFDFHGTKRPEVDKFAVTDAYNLLYKGLQTICEPLMRDIVKKGKYVK